MVNRNYILNKLRGRIVSPEEFDYDALTAPPLYSLLTPTDVGDLNKLATSIRYAGNPILRLDRIDQIMRRRGFEKFTGGTNRVIYKFLEDDRFLVKVASDAVGVGDSPREYINQFRYKPFITKVFETSPCGTLGLFERGIPIRSRQEFFSIASYVYDVIRNWFTGEYVMDDIGSDYFLNWVIRPGFGPILCDFPYSYKLDGNKLYCNAPLKEGGFCGGVIDYDDGYNHLHCTKCGLLYKAKDLELAIKNDKIIKQGGKTKMNVVVMRGNDISQTFENPEEFCDVTPNFVPRKARKASEIGDVEITFGNRKSTITVDKLGNNIKDNEMNKVEVEIVRENVSDEPVKDDKEPEENNAQPRVVVINGVDASSSNQPVTEDTATEEVTTPSGIVGIVEVIGSVTNTTDLAGCTDKIKCIALYDKDGEPLTIDDNEGTFHVVLSNIDNKAMSDVCIMTTEAENKLTQTIERNKKSIEKYKKDIKALKAELLATKNQLNTTTSELLEANTELDRLKKDYDHLLEDHDLAKEEYEELQMNSICIPESPLVPKTEPTKKEIEDIVNELKSADNDVTASGSIEEENKQLKEEIEDKELVAKIDELLPDDKIQYDIDSDPVFSIPVGATPPIDTEVITEVKPASVKKKEEPKRGPKKSVRRKK